MTPRHLRPVETRVARRHAAEVAELLGSKAASNRAFVLGEALCPYKVPFHSEQFWFTVLVSDLTFEFRGNHKRGSGVPTPFCLTLKAPWKTMLATTPVPVLSRALGIDVYASELTSQAVPTALLLDAPIRTSLREIDFTPVERVFLNRAQIRVWSEFVDAHQCAMQVRLFRGLLLQVYAATAQDRST